MLLVIPPSTGIDNAITQVKHEVFYKFSVSSTYLNDIYHIIPEGNDVSNLKMNNLFSANIKFEEIESRENSTWQENEINEFNVDIKVDFKKAIKIKSKIKTVSKYKPNIIID